MCDMMLSQQNKRALPDFFSLKKEVGPMGLLLRHHKLEGESMGGT